MQRRVEGRPERKGSLTIRMSVFLAGSDSGLSHGMF